MDLARSGLFGWLVGGDLRVGVALPQLSVTTAPSINAATPKVGVTLSTLAIAGTYAVAATEAWQWYVDGVAVAGSYVIAPGDIEISADVTASTAGFASALTSIAPVPVLNTAPVSANSSGQADVIAGTAPVRPVFMGAAAPYQNTAPGLSMVSNVLHTSGNADRLIVGVWTIEKNATTQVLTALAATLNTPGGNIAPTWTKLVSASQYPIIFMAAWVAPPANADVTTTLTIDAAFRSVTADVLEFSNVNQTTPIGAENSAYAGSNTGGTRTLTTTVDNVALVAACAWNGGNKTLTLSGQAAATVIYNGNSGATTTTNDTTSGVSIGDADAAGSYSVTQTASAADHNVWALVAIRPT